MRILAWALGAVVFVGVGVGGTYTGQRITDRSSTACSIASSWANSAFKTQEARPPAVTQAEAEQQYQASERIAALRHNACD